LDRESKEEGENGEEIDEKMVKKGGECEEKEGESEIIEEKPLIRFGLITDVQYAQKPEKFSSLRRLKRFSTALVSLTQAIDFFNTQQIDFMIHLGDIIDGNDTEEQTQAEFAAVLESLSRINPAIPTYHVIGNHCLSVDRTQLIRSLHIPPTGYYSFQLQNWRFVVLDTLEFSLKWPEGSPNHQQAKKWLEDHPNEENAVTWNGGLTAVQQAWLEQELNDAKNLGERVLVFAHVPLLKEAIRGEGRHLLYDRDVILRLLDRFPGTVVGWFSGHYHEGGYALRNQCHHVTFEAILEATKRAGEIPNKKIEESIHQENGKSGEKSAKVIQKENFERDGPVKAGNHKENGEGDKKEITRKPHSANEKENISISENQSAIMNENKSEGMPTNEKTSTNEKETERGDAYGIIEIFKNHIKIIGYGDITSRDLKV